MKKNSKTLYLFLFCFLTIFPNVSLAAISLSNGQWETTFNYGECTQRVDCPSPAPDGIVFSWGAADVQGNYTQVTAAANNPKGKGGNGVRFFVGDGKDVYSGQIKVDFPFPQKEIWIRWYMRYEAGYAWSNLSYDKWLYIRSDGSGSSQVSAIPEWDSGLHHSRIYAQNSNPTLNYPTSSWGWYETFGGTVGDGKWHCYEIHLKMDTGANNGIGEMWIDGEKKMSNFTVDWSGGSAVAQNGWKWFDFQNNNNSPGNGRAMYVDYDDIVISTTGYIGPIGGTTDSGTTDSGTTDSGTTDSGTTDSGTTDSGTTDSGTLLFEEKFEDANLASRGWYDNTNLTLSSVEHVSDSTKSAEFRFTQGATQPTSGGAIRKKFTDTDSVYISYYVKYSANWEGSNRSYHPHEFYLLTNEDGDWSNLAYTNLTAYIEQNEGKPSITFQDARNIDISRVGQDLTNITEMRGIAGCNGDSDGYGNGTCYSSGSVYVNGKDWRTGNIYFSDNSGPYYKNDWHHVEVFIKLNSIVDGKGVADGIIQYWFDGETVMDYKDVVLRTGQHPDMKFNQFVIAPWIGDGSPVDQTFWVDNLKVMTSLGQSSTTELPQPPTNLRILSN